MVKRGERSESKGGAEQQATTTAVMTLAAPPTIRAF